MEHQAIASLVCHYVDGFASKFDARRQLAQLGFKELGSGMFGSAHEVPGDTTIVVKLTAVEDAWLDYAMFCMMNADASPHLLRVYAMQCEDNYAVTVIERLERGANEMVMQRIRDDIWHRRGADVLVKLADAIDCCDMHDGNFMRRADGETVITDPSTVRASDKKYRYTNHLTNGRVDVQTMRDRHTKRTATNETLRLEAMANELRVGPPVVNLGFATIERRFIHKMRVSRMPLERWPRQKRIDDAPRVWAYNDQVFPLWGSRVRRSTAVTRANIRRQEEIPTSIRVLGGKGRILFRYDRATNRLHYRFDQHGRASERGDLVVGCRGGPLNLSQVRDWILRRHGACHNPSIQHVPGAEHAARLQCAEG